MVADPTPSQIRHARDCLGRTSGGDIPDDLNDSLEPFRGRPPIRLRCGARGCAGTVVWTALHPVLPLAVCDPLGPRKGMVARKRRQPEQPQWLAPQPPTPYNYWSPGSLHEYDPTTSAEAHGPLGPQYRWSFKCRRCERAYTLKNETVIGLIVDSAARNVREMRLGTT
jgi:hypothetical protein